MKRRLAGIICLGLLLLIRPESAAAKQVTIEWEPMDGAVAYEIRIEQESTIVQKTIEQPLWKGDLPFGAYTYQLRAIDRLERPGVWTAPLQLAVMAQPPEPIAPANGANFRFFHPDFRTVLSWKPVSGVSQYRVIVKRGKNTHRESVVQGTSLDLGALSSGEYSWTLSSVIESSKRGATPSARRWTSEPGRPLQFTVERGTLTAPPILFPPPAAALPPNPETNLELRWGAVRGAEAYEVSFANSKSLVTKTPSTVLRFPAEGAYQWKVRALAHFDAKNTAKAIGPEAISTFTVDQNAVITQGTGYVAVSTLLAPYSYRVTSPSFGFKGSTASSAMALRLSGEHWTGPNWGMGAAIENTGFVFSGKNFNRLAGEAVAKYQTRISHQKFGWFVAPKAGMEFRQYFALAPSTSVEDEALFGIQSEKTTFYGALLGLDLRKQFSESWSLGAKASAFIPLVLTGLPGAKLTGDASYRNFSFGAQGFYWMGKGWGVSAGAFMETRSISYMKTGQTEAEQVFMDAAYFFGSVLYRW